MNEAAYEAASETHPLLKNSVTERLNAWIAYTNSDDSVANWQRSRFPNGLVGDLARCLFVCDNLLELGDMECKALYPVVFASDPGGLVPEGTKVKKVGDEIPALLVGTEKYLTGLLWLGGGFTDHSYDPRTIRSVRQIKVGGMLVVPKYDGVMLEVEEDGETEVGLFMLPQLLRIQQVQTAFQEIRSLCA